MLLFELTMAELLSVHVHIPRCKETVVRKPGLIRQNSFNNGKYDLAVKRKLDIEFRELTYTVKDGSNKGKR